MENDYIKGEKRIVDVGNAGYLDKSLIKCDSDLTPEPAGSGAEIKNGITEVEGTVEQKLTMDTYSRDNNDIRPVHLSTHSPSPLLEGILSCNISARTHILRGMWNYESSEDTPSQRFELVQNLNDKDDPTHLPKNGEFHGSFTVSYFHTTSKGKRKKRSKVIAENGVRIYFKRSNFDGSFDVSGEGTNQFGVFQIVGKAVKSSTEEKPIEYNVILRKKYKTTPLSLSTSSSTKNTKRKLSITEDTQGSNDLDFKIVDLLPPPSQSYQSNVVCLKGNIVREGNDQNGVVHKISGLWASGLDLIEADPFNTLGLCNRFEYEHRCTVPTDVFPLSGRYTGWFNLTTEGGNKRINERDVLIKFGRNNLGNYNVEGKGNNVFGKYSISGTLSSENIIVIFRHFQPQKVKEVLPVSSATNSKIYSIDNYFGKTPIFYQKTEYGPFMTLNDVVIPKNDLTQNDFVKAFTTPAHGEYTAILRGVLRINDDGSHTCSGKWAISRELYNSNQCSNFKFELDAENATLAGGVMKLKKNVESKNICSNDKTNSVEPKDIIGGHRRLQFPVDSASYKGTFKMKIRAGKTYQLIHDKQIVLKFHKVTNGCFNVYGKGINLFGNFSLTGCLITSGMTGSGHIELYRLYKTHVNTPKNKPLPKTPNVMQPSRQGKTLPLVRNNLPPINSIASSQEGSPQTHPATPYQVKPTSAGRRESSRQTKLPSRLEDNYPQARIVRMMDKCNVILKFIREKDKSAGGFFAEPVDPVAHGIPNYHEVISKPMDLGTIQLKMDANEVNSPEEFTSLVRQVFENGVNFNVDPNHVVHTTARDLLALFNQKIRDVERATDNINKERKTTKSEVKEAKKKQKEEKENKRQDEKRLKSESKTPKEKKEINLTKIQNSSEDIERDLTSLINSSVSIGEYEYVTKGEYNLLLQLIQKMHIQMVGLQTLMRSYYVSEIAKQNKKSTSKKAANKNSPIVSTVERNNKSVQMGEVFNKDLPLSLVEQQDLTEAINNMDQDKLQTVIDIIRESDALNEDEDEIDLEIDQLDTTTQRKLQRFVNKNTRKYKVGKKCGKKRSSEVLPNKVQSISSLDPYSHSKSKTSSSLDVFFSFSGNGDGSDNESQKNIEKNTLISNNNREISDQPTANKNVSFIVNDDGDTGFVDNSILEEDADAMKNGTMATNWGMSKPAECISGKNHQRDDDDAWAAARGASAAQKALDRERQERKEKVWEGAEAVNEKHLAEAAALGKKIQEQRKEKESEVARRKDKEENEQAQKAREQALANFNSIQPTVDLDAQRDIMRAYDFYEKDADFADGVSPSSDFGF